MKPILYNTEMVRGLLANRKTVTRRVVKPQPRYSLAQMPIGHHKGEWHEYKKSSLEDPTITSPWGFQYMPPYRPGDILYVRETWCKYGELDAAERVIPGTEKYYYRADGENPTPFNSFLVQHPGWDEYREVPVWRPSIHMPREAARIFLRVTDVRVERLQDITEEQAQKEGLYRGWVLTERSTPALTARQAFMWVWDMTIKPAARALYGWVANPWVWVIEFEQISREEALHDPLADGR